MKLLNDAHLWALVPKGISERFPSPNARRVELHVNSSHPVRWFIEYLCDVDPVGRPVPKGERFLAKTDGLDKIVFVTPGPYRIWHMEDEAHVLLYTRDGALQHREAIDEETFTRYHEGPMKDPQIAAIEERMFARMQRRLKIMEAELENKYAQRNDGAATDNNVADEHAPGVGTTVDTPSEPDGSQPDEAGS